MIKNERQYGVTRTQLERFRALRDELRSRPQDPGDEMRRLKLAAVEAQVDELSEQLQEYEALRSGRETAGAIESLADLPLVLTRARIAQRLTQRNLAELLGMKEQQIQRYEATDWKGASLARLLEVAQALELQVADVTSPPTERDMLRSLQRLGVDRDFVDRRLVPESDGESRDSYLLELASRVARVFGWSVRALLRGETPAMAIPAKAGIAFKIPKAAQEGRARLLTAYSDYLVGLVLTSTKALAQGKVPSDWSDLRAGVLNSYGDLTLRSCLRYVWDVGIAVVPLSEQGGFHAALWRQEGRNVIVLKQGNRTESRWLFDLLHELHHASNMPDEVELLILDTNDTGMPVDDDVELQANTFAGNVLLNGRAEAITAECVDAAGGSVERLKSVVPLVARRNNVATADIANYLAYRLSLQGINWWGTASNLQGRGEDPWSICRDILLQRTDFATLPEIDQQILVHALSD